MSSIYVVSAMCGCWWVESGCNPQIWESLVPCAWDYKYEYTHKGGYGLGQWTNVGTQHGRLYNLHTWVTQNGYADGDGNGQLEFMIHEAYWKNRDMSRTGAQSLNDFLNSSSTNLNDLVYDFLACWEGVPNNKYSKRCAKAQEAFTYIQQHEGEHPSWVNAGNHYVSNSTWLNNCLVIYNYLGGYAPTGNPIIVHSSGNGSAFAIPSSVEAGDTFTLYANSGDGDTIESITATDANFNDIPMYLESSHTYTYDPSWGSFIEINVVFSGDTPQREFDKWYLLFSKRDWWRY